MLNFLFIFYFDMKFANVTIVSKLCTCMMISMYVLNPIVYWIPADAQRQLSIITCDIYIYRLFGFSRFVVDISRPGSTHNVFSGSVILYECCWVSDSLWMLLQVPPHIKVTYSANHWGFLSHNSTQDRIVIRTYTMYDSGQDSPSNYHRLLKNNKDDI